MNNYINYKTLAVLVQNTNQGPSAISCTILSEVAFPQEHTVLSRQGRVQQAEHHPALTQQFLGLAAIVLLLPVSAASASASCVQATTVKILLSCSPALSLRA